MTSDQPNERVVMQRMRNNILDCLELASSFEEQRKFQSRAPGLNVPTEVLDLWWACVSDDWRQSYGPPVFTEIELEAIACFDTIQKGVSNSTPDPMPPLAEMLGWRQWEQLRAAAEIAAGVFAVRGRLSADEEDA
jgi:hypothetical protein